jgi:hypothetical protein
VTLLSTHVIIVANYHTHQNAAPTKVYSETHWSNETCHPPESGFEIPEIASSLA